MKASLKLSVLTFLLTIAAGECLAEIGIVTVTPAKAKEWGMELRLTGNAPNDTWVELEFKTNAPAPFTNFSHVGMEIRDGEKLLVGWAPLNDERTASGTLLVRFMANREYLKKVTLRVVTKEALGGTGYDLRVKDFVELPKSASIISPEEETRFLAAVRKAFDAHDVAGMDSLTCWDGIQDELKERIRAGYKGLVEQQGCTFDFKLEMARHEWSDNGIKPGLNPPKTRQLNVTCSSASDKKTLLRIVYPVGEKDGKLLLLSSEEAK